MIHIMLDLETLGTDHDAAIVAIGAVVFSPYAPELGFKHQFYTTVDPQSAIDDGGTVTGRTIQWWMNQTAEARAVTFGAEGVKSSNIKSALKDFTAFVRDLGDHREIAVWGNGATFDNIILRSALKRAGIEAPWSFRNDKCYRTVKNLVPAGKLPEYIPPLIAHYALHDALAQAIYLQKCYSVLGLTET